MESEITSHIKQESQPTCLQQVDNSLIDNNETNGQDFNKNESRQNTVSLGKFKDSAELLTAYSNLEKEFTKRSQRLKILEAEVEKTKSLQVVDSQEMMKRMVNINPDLDDIISLAQQEMPESSDNSSIETRLAQALKGKILPKEQEAKYTYLDKIINEDDALKERILSKALDKLPSFSLPKLNKYRGQTIITPPNRPKNLAEAGRLAENILNNRSK